MSIWESILLATSLCADCFAVALCSGTTMKRHGLWAVLSVALAFSAVHICFMFFGWLFGSLILGLVERISRWIGFALLLYVGGTLLLQGVFGKTETRLLDSPLNVLLTAVATSIDALAVGAAKSLEGLSFGDMLPLLAMLFAVTLAAVSAGIAGGRALKQSAGRAAEIAGGLVLIGIGVSVLF